jgi:hypothetical protein
MGKKTNLYSDSNFIIDSRRSRYINLLMVSFNIFAYEKFLELIKPTATSMQEWMINHHKQNLNMF